MFFTLKSMTLFLFTFSLSVQWKMKLELGRQQKSNHSQNPGFALFVVMFLLFISIITIRYTDIQRRGWCLGRLWQWAAEELKEGQAWGEGGSHLRWRWILGYPCAKDLENKSVNLLHIQMTISQIDSSRSVKGSWLQNQVGKSILRIRLLGNYLPEKKKVAPNMNFCSA